MKEYNFELIRGDDYSFLLKIKLPPTSNIDILSCNFRLQARIIEMNKSNTSRSNGFLSRGQLKAQNDENYLKAKSENKLILSLSTEDGGIKVLDNGDIVLLFKHNDTDLATWKEASYDLQMITSSGKYKTIMRGKLTLISDITE